MNDTDHLLDRPSQAMHPNLLTGLNHFTVPVLLILLYALDGC